MLQVAFKAGPEGTAKAYMRKSVVKFVAEDETLNLTKKIHVQGINRVGRK